jgi:hypothetical protein
MNRAPTSMAQFVGLTARLYATCIADPGLERFAAQLPQDLVHLRIELFVLFKR